MPAGRRADRVSEADTGYVLPQSSPYRGGRETPIDQCPTTDRPSVRGRPLAESAVIRSAETGTKDTMAQGATYERNVMNRSAENCNRCRLYFKDGDRMRMTLFEEDPIRNSDVTSRGAIAACQTRVNESAAALSFESRV